MAKYKQHFSREEAQLITGVFAELVKLNTSELMYLVGSQGVKKVLELNHKLSYYDYCKRNGKKIEELDEYDYEQAYCEKWGS